MYVSLRVLIVCVTVWLLAADATAQQITSPSAGSLFRAGPDYATDILQDPWDFSNVEDVSPDPNEFLGWSTNPPNLWFQNGTGQTFINTSVGRFVGTANGDNAVSLLNRGDGMGLNPGRTGIKYPIPTSRYGKFAMKAIYSGVPSGGYPTVFWMHGSYFDPNYLNRGGGVLLDLVPGGNTTKVFVKDLATLSAGQLIPACAGSGCTGTPAVWGAESGVRGFRVDPNTDAGVMGVQIDWVRITAPDSDPSAAMMNVTFQSCPNHSLSVSDSAGDLTVVSSSGGTATSARFNYGIFPPGNYSLVLSCNGTPTSTVPFTINTPPRVTVIDPDEVGDPATDYAFRVNGNRWDFEEPTASDVVTKTNVSEAAGVCAFVPCGTITSDRPGAPAGSKMYRASSAGTSGVQFGDPGLEFLGGATTPLSSLRHRFLTFSLRINRPYDVGLGSVARVIWGSQNIVDQSTATVSQDLRVWPGFNTYTVDLGPLTAANGGIETECVAVFPPCLTTPWGTRSIRFFRLDPFEFPDTPTAFDIDDVSLTAPDEVSLDGSGPGSSYTIRWSVAEGDAAPGTYRTRIFLDTDRDRSNGLGTELTSAPGLNTVLGANQFNWTPPPTTPSNSYWVYVQATETRGTITDTQGSYATGPLVVYSRTATSPSVTVLSPTPNATVTFPFTITGCAFDQGNSNGINMDDLAVYAIAGNGVADVPAGTTYALGFSSTPTLGTLEWAPLTPTTPVVCPTITNPSSPFRNSGFRLSGVHLHAGPWSLRVFARSTISGEMVRISDIPVVVSQLSQGPTNLQVSAVGNVVTASWQAPVGGPTVTGYVIDIDTQPGFTSIFANVIVPANITSGSGSLPNGTFYLRVVSLAGAGARQNASETRSITLPAGGPTPPGAPVLAATQVTSNPISASWSAGPGGAPTSYTLQAGTSPGSANLVSVPMGTVTSISAVAPVGVRIYLRVVAQNAAGSATSNEIDFMLAAPTPPGPPTLQPAVVSGHTVSLTWSASAGSAPTGYTILGRLTPTGPVVVLLPVSGTSLSVAAPSGTYYVSLVAANAAGTSTESNQIMVVVP